MFWGGLVCGLIIGVFAGVFMIALLSANSNEEKEMERRRKECDNNEY